jgi:hypothetical protein
MSFQEISDEEIASLVQTAEKIAEQVAKNSLESTSHRINVVGPHASSGEQKNGIFIDKGENRVFVVNSNKESYIFNGLDNATIRIMGQSKTLTHGQSGKINHVLIRDCCHVRIQIDDGVISGVTIINGKKILVDLPIQNTTFIEQTSEATVRGQVTQDTIIYIAASQEIFINNENLHIHPFVQGIFTRGFFFPIRYIPHELQVMTRDKITRVQLQPKYI